MARASGRRSLEAPRPTRRVPTGTFAPGVSGILRGIVAMTVGAALLGCGPSGARDETASRDTGVAEADTVPRRSGLPPRGEAWVIFRNDTVRAEVAETAEARERGLMYRQQVPPGTGMLFVFQDEAVRSFWMRNTYVPLDIAFLDAAMRVVDIEQMEPETDTLYPSDDPAMFALEVPQGWFAEHGIEEGSQAEIVFGPR